MVEKEPVYENQTIKKTVLAALADLKYAARCLDCRTVASHVVFVRIEMAIRTLESLKLG